MNNESVFKIWQNFDNIDNVLALKNIHSSDH